MSTTLILIRHGETRLNALGVFQGQLDEPLSEVGLGQARAAAVSMAGLRPDALYASDLQRARQTADEVARLTGQEVRTDERLREIHCGSWQGRSIAEVSQEFPQLVEFRRSGQDFRRSATGETAAELADRVCEGLLDIIKENKNQTVMIASHGLAIRVGIARLLGLPDELSMTLGTMQNCRYALVSHSKRRVRLSAYNLPS
ncbi:MAG: histidine phosphatase family protein [Propionibacteriaceae bacterium]|nr:histidine phosphatase family protein [Propionibacteriaceae bacterium]